MDIEAWLRGLGLEHAPAFRDNDIDAEILPDLTAEDLIGLGVTSIGHRRILRAAVVGLRDGPHGLARALLRLQQHDRVTLPVARRCRVPNAASLP